MIYDYMRVFYFDGSSLTDYSNDNQDDSRAVPLDLALGDYIYIGQRLPFSTAFFYMAAPDNLNDEESALQVEYWGGQGNGWIPAVDVVDGTSEDGKTLAKSGLLQWSNDDRYSWSRVSDTTDDSAPPALAGLHIYETYWARISVTNALSADTAANEITFALTESQELKKVDMRIDEFLPAFGKADGEDWTIEVMSGSKLMAADLKKKGLINQPGQIIELDDVYLPATYRTLQLIYENLGPAYASRATVMAQKYEDALNSARFVFDEDSSGSITESELIGRPGRLVR